MGVLNSGNGDTELITLKEGTHEVVLHNVKKSQQRAYQSEEIQDCLMFVFKKDAITEGSKHTEWAFYKATLAFGDRSKLKKLLNSTVVLSMQDRYYQELENSDTVEALVGNLKVLTGYDFNIKIEGKKSKNNGNVYFNITQIEPVAKIDPYKAAEPVEDVNFGNQNTQTAQQPVNLSQPKSEPSSYAEAVAQEDDSDGLPF